LCVCLNLFSPVAFFFPFLPVYLSFSCSCMFYSSFAIPDFSLFLIYVGIATAYGLDCRGVAFRVQVRVKNFLHVVQIGSGVHQTSYPMGTGGLFPTE
jgi:hypothetical protein